MKKLSRKQTAMLIGFLVLSWGVSWPISKIALLYTPPVLFSGMRTLLGGIVLLIFAWPRLRQLRFKETWYIYFLSALLNVVIYIGLQTVGLEFLPAGLFSAIVFLQPVLTGVFAWMWLGESMSILKILGLIFGFAGVAVISTGGMSGDISLFGILFALITAVSWALGTVYVKKVGETVDAIWMVSLQLIIGGMVLTGVGSGIESWSNIVWNLPYILILLYTSFLVFSIGWLVYFVLINSGEASKVASYTFLIPLVAIIVSTLFYNEPLTLSLLAGIALIILSIYFVNHKPKKLVA